MYLYSSFRTTQYIDLLFSFEFYPDERFGDSKHGESCGIPNLR